MHWSGSMLSDVRSLSGRGRMTRAVGGMRNVGKPVYSAVRGEGMWLITT